MVFELREPWAWALGSCHHAILLLFVPHVTSSPKGAHEVVSKAPFGFKWSFWRGQRFVFTKERMWTAVCAHWPVPLSQRSSTVHLRVTRGARISLLLWAPQAHFPQNLWPRLLWLEHSPRGFDAQQRCTRIAPHGYFLSRGKILSRKENYAFPGGTVSFGWE